MNKSTIILAIGLALMTVAIAADLGQTPSEVNIPDADIDTIKEWYGFDVLNPTASAIKEYDGECWFSLSHELNNEIINLGNRINFDCEGMDSRARLQARDDAIVERLQLLANVIRARQARIDDTVVVDGGGNITVSEQQAPP